MPVTLPLDEMTVAEKLQLMETLWSDLSRHADALESREWHGEILAERGRRKAALVYGAVDASGGFFQAAVAMPWRSPVNVCFRLGQAELTDHFVAEAEAAGLHYLRGHPQLGGLRASLYNALPEAGAAALADFMIDFQRRWG